MRREIHVKKWSVAWMGVSEGGAWKRGQGLIRSWVVGGDGGGPSYCGGGGGDPTVERRGALALYLCQPTPTCAGRESLFPSHDAAVVVNQKTNTEEEKNK